MLSIYFKELVYSLKIFSLTFLSLIIFSFKKFLIFVIFLIYPILKIIKKKLLILHILDLLNISFNISFNISLIFSFLFLFKCIFFWLKNCWFSIQTDYLNFFFINLKFLSFSHFLIFSLLSLIFSYNLNLGFSNSFSFFDVQLHGLDFINLLIYLFYIFSHFLIFSFSHFLILKTIFSWSSIFYLFKRFKISFLLTLIFILMIISSDSVNFLFIFLFINLVLEFFFASVCFRLSF